MIRFAHYNDTHFTGKIPRHRTDDYPKAILGKVREVYAEAKKEGCDFVTFGGDFFNVHRVFSFELIGDAMDIICESGIPTYGCIGEHDLYGHSPSTYQSSTLAFFIRRCPNFRIIRDPIEVAPGVVLHAKHEWEKMDEAMKRNVDASKLNILVCHELITNESSLVAFDVIDTSSLNPCPFDVVVSGDLHCGFPTHCVGNTWFCNPGSIARQKSTDSSRHPQFAILEVEKGSDPVIQIRKIACAKPGEEIFGESIAEMVRTREEFKGDVFTEEILKFEAEATDVHELIKNVGRANGVRQAVLDYLATKKGEVA